MDHYQAPNLPDEDIGSALSSGLLGEQIAHVTVEQLKSASPALVLQLCVSMLQKLDVDTDHLGQPFLQPQLDEPDQYQNATFFALHIPRLFYALVPGCNPKRICTADLLNPKWIKLKKFLSILINYFRFMETNKPAFSEINTKSEELHKNVEESEDRNSKLRGALLEIDEYMTRNSELHHERHCEKEEVEKKLQNILAQKDMKHNSKEGSKKSAEKATEAFNSLITQHDHILEKINDMKKLIVTSPKKQILERAELKQKLDVTNEDEANVQDQIQAQKWSIEKHEDIIKRLEYTLKLCKKYLEFYDKLKTIKTGLMKEKFQTDEDKMALVCIRQEIDNLKQIKLDERDQIHRTKLRGQNILAHQKQHLQELTNQTEMLLSDAQSKDQQVKTMLSAIQKEEAAQCKENERHSNAMAQIEAMLSELTNAVEQTYVNANTCMREIVAARSAGLKSYLNAMH